MPKMQFENKRILIVGDVMLDSEILGEVGRISPEAPVPVVHARQERHTLGGAAFVAHNVKSVGAEPYLVGVVGTDATKKKIEEEFEKRGILTTYLIEEEGRKTTEKIRCFGNNQQMIRLDYEDINQMRETTERRIKECIKKLIPSMDICIVSDYNKGSITKGVLEEIFKNAQEQKKKVIIDGKPQKREWYKGADIIIWNESEAREIISGKEQKEIKDILKEITKRDKAAIVITRGKNGIMMSNEKGEIETIQGKEVEVADRTGVGDIITSILGVALGSGYTLFEAAKLANYAAGLAVTKRGTAVVTKEEIQQFLRLNIYEYLKESIRVKEAMIEKQIDKIEDVATLIIEAYKKGNKLLVFGNGGSAADAQHLAAEFVGRYKKERKGLPAIALTTNTSILTAIGNDYGYDMVFSRQIEALCKPGDIVIGISTSGNSPNVIKAFETAKQQGAKTIAWTGKDGGKAAKEADIAIIVPSENTPRIQEVHVTLIHIICELFEEQMEREGYL